MQRRQFLKGLVAASLFTVTGFGWKANPPPTLLRGRKVKMLWCDELDNFPESAFQEQLMAQVVEGMNHLEDKIRRNREYQAHQILQTGILIQ